MEAEECLRTEFGKYLGASFIRPYDKIYGLDGFAIKDNRPIWLEIKTRPNSKFDDFEEYNLDYHKLEVGALKVMMGGKFYLVYAFGDGTRWFYDYQPEDMANITFSTIGRKNRDANEREKPMARIPRYLFKSW
jgi:hypothetical protein